ncbi:eukaryotic translation initiation factor 3 subunit A [Colletotrichum abscissum]|uniref:Eukaryotic translation initiation factor 3 subunit A n=5 Tax=Colletotrichum acutatum species complex TaxID=2707335 RepID=A0A9P9X539_9PEZI|nr:eukaryotic translation initiation factor 3 subunit A [Colletotrichum lupini]XP_060319495.1 eukaryotic translation initiation factor 3 subunit A [Colletotrichum costaricense]XP_060383247.1 eukaryotic translation initiation factor 3 subunit A [Colletotrichum tamarilloi]XP_060391816.1 eukaryotic translation initiation factor 3 subunit A [Colletotrichum abscissum]KAK0381498.1 eukaryotic translation initiation factor 3 subunit A [Colletotrichum limetticola]KAI3537295.1 eukaryotic translation ini
MPPPPHQKPENVLKRAHELIGVNQVPAALTLLHEHITSKRSRNVPIASLEPVMLLLVELSVEQKKGKLAKDALYQYKNISQNTNIGTIELVLKKFIELAAEKVTVAQAKADEVQSSIEANTSTTNVDDLEASETPESILLATVSGEQSRDRTDRAIVTPWLKFLWEAYRTVLDILRNNARLEILYQSTAMQAFDFCLKYTRKTEFRRLCELLRNHVQTAAKYSAQMHAINLSDPDTLQRHLETRFQQLNVAVELELWQEAFRSVEDIHTLLNLSKRPPKNIMMANYYEKLTRIFLVGENYLFHAAAWSRYYTLLRQSAAVVASGQGKKADNPPATENDLQKAASFVLLSALAIPVISTTRSRGAMVDFDESRKNKNARLTHLLGMGQAPTRAGLFRDALAKQMLKRARPEIRDLYNILEVDFHPLSICQKISPILTKIGDDAEMEKYILPLQQVILTRLFQQLSQVYETVDLAFVEKLAQFPEPFQVTRGTIEKFIMNGNKKGDLAIRMDHATGVLSFDNDVFSSAKAAHAGSSAGSAEADGSSVQRLQSTPSEIVRSQLTRLVKSLHTTCFYIDPTYNQSLVAAREAALERARAGAEQEHHSILARKEVIHKRKEEASEAQARKERENARQKRLREQLLQEAEDKRLAAEQREREEKRMKAERDRVRKEELKKQIADLKIGNKTIDIDMDNLENLDSGAIHAIKLEQLKREKNDVSEKLRIVWKRIDHLERAFRKEEAKKLPEDYKKQTEQDRATYEAVKAQTLKEAEIKHKESVELKHRLTRLMPEYESFRANLHERRRDEFEKRRRDAERELEKQIAARKKEYRDRKLREKREREEQERVLREAEERAAKEKEEQERRAEAKRAEMQRLKEQREQERQEGLEKAALQARREEEALARRKAERESQRAAPPSRVPERGTDSVPEGRRPLNLPGAGKWREREAANKAASPANADAAPAARAPPSRGPERSERPERSDRYERPSERAERSERPERSEDRPSAGGPPRLALAGNKPSWREREAAKTASGGGASSDSAPPPPRASGDRGGAPLNRGGSGRDDRENGRPDRTASPATPAEPLKASGAPGKWVPRHLRDKA